MYTHEWFLEHYDLDAYDHFLRWYSAKYPERFGEDGRPVYPAHLVEFWQKQYGLDQKTSK